MQPNRTRTKRALHAGKSFPPREKGRFIFPGRHNALPPCAASERHSSLRRGSFNSLTITPTRIRAAPRDRKSVVSGKSVSVSVDHGGRRIIKKKKNQPNKS